MELVDTKYLTKKTKLATFKLGKTVIALNGILSTSIGIAGFIPSVQRAITANGNSQSNINASLFYATTLFLGVSNLSSLLTLDVASTINQLRSNAIGYGIYAVLGSYYYYKTRQNANLGVDFVYTSTFWKISAAITGLSLLSSTFAISRMNSTFTGMQKMTLKLKGKKVKQVEKTESKQDDSNTDTDTVTTDAPKYGAGVSARDGPNWRAAAYKYEKAPSTEDELKSQTHTITVACNEDDMVGVDAIGCVIFDCQNSNFKVESNKNDISSKISDAEMKLFKENDSIFPIKGCILEECSNVNAQVSYCKKNINLVNCKNCSLFITHRAPVIEVSGCSNIKLSIMKEAVAYYDEYIYYFRESADSDVVKKQTKTYDISCGSIREENASGNIETLSKEESKKFITYMNNRKCNEKWQLVKRNINEPSINVALTNNLELSINYFGTTKPLDSENETWMDFNVPYRAGITLDLINGKAQAKFQQL